MEEQLEKALFVLRLISPTAAIFTAVTLAIVLAPVFYVIVRWRTRDHVQDTQIGLKFALYYFALFAFQLTLLGLMLLLFTMLAPKDSTLLNILGGEKGPTYRAALGMMVPGGIILGAHVALLRKTNDDVFVNVRRIFGGFNLLFTGLVAFLGLICGFQALFAKDGTGLGHFAAAVVLTYGAAWGACVWWYGRLILGGGGFVTPSQPMHMMPPMPQPMPPPSAYAALPPLGGPPYPPPDAPR
ncbi:MAG: hypothetical protein KF773_11900 [Deltaproteobacteria bacterium]|nr:hypothetical protein [Deltaproteobacteria bacterium]